MRRVLCITMLLLSLRAVPPLAAQATGQDRVGLSQPSAGTEPGRPQFVMPRAEGGSYWKVGALITAAPVVIVANIMMDDSDDGILVNIVKRVFGSAVLGAVFALPGALIGKQFTKN